MKIDPLQKCRAIVFIPGHKPKKYFTVDARPGYLDKFLNAMKAKFGNYSAVNLYYRTGELYMQVKGETGQSV